MILGMSGPFTCDRCSPSAQSLRLRGNPGPHVSKAGHKPLVCCSPLHPGDTLRVGFPLILDLAPNLSTGFAGDCECFAIAL